MKYILLALFGLLAAAPVAEACERKRPVVVVNQAVVVVRPAVVVNPAVVVVRPAVLIVR